MVIDRMMGVSQGVAHMKSFALVLALFSTPLFASVTHDCGSLNDIGMLLETKSFDSVKVAYVSTEEPAAAPDHVLVFVYDHEMGYTCTAISPTAESGYSYVDLRSVRSIAYDGRKGRLLEITVYPTDQDGMKGGPEVVRFRANAVSGKTTLE